MKTKHENRAESIKISKFQVDNNSCGVSTLTISIDSSSRKVHLVVMKFSCL